MRERFSGAKTNSAEREAKDAENRVVQMSVGKSSNIQKPATGSTLLETQQEVENVKRKLKAA